MEKLAGTSSNVNLVDKVQEEKSNKMIKE